MPKTKKVPLPKLKKLKPWKIGGKVVGGKIKGLMKSGKISPTAAQSVLGSQIGVKKPRGGVGKGMAGM